MASKHAGSDLRVVLVGQVGVGKSSAGNTILAKEAFECGFSPSSVTQSSTKIEGDVEGRRVAVVDTPQIISYDLSPEQIKAELLRAVELSSPGLHVFLLILTVGRFCQEDQKAVESLEKMLGPNVYKHTMLLFTHRDILEDIPIKLLISRNSDLQNLLEKCSGYCHVFNNKEIRDRKQVRELLCKIDAISQGGHRVFAVANNQEEEMKQLKDTVQKLQSRVEELEQKKEGEHQAGRKQEDRLRKVERQLERVKQRSIQKDNSEKHFIDRHRAALIKGVKMVDGVLDLLLERDVLDQAAYDHVRAGNRRGD